MAPSVGFLGMGIMGTAMARNLNNSGLFGPISVWNRTLSKVWTKIGLNCCIAGILHAYVIDVGNSRWLLGNIECLEQFWKCYVAGFVVIVIDQWVHDCLCSGFE